MQPSLQTPIRTLLLLLHPFNSHGTVAITGGDTILPPLSFVIFWNQLHFHSLSTIPKVSIHIPLSVSSEPLTSITKSTGMSSEPLTSVAAFETSIPRIEHFEYHSFLVHDVHTYRHCFMLTVSCPNEQVV